METYSHRLDKEFSGSRLLCSLSHTFSLWSSSNDLCRDFCLWDWSSWWSVSRQTRDRQTLESTPFWHLDSLYLQTVSSVLNTYRNYGLTHTKTQFNLLPHVAGECSQRVIIWRLATVLYVIAPDPAGLAWPLPPHNILTDFEHHFLPQT